MAIKRNTKAVSDRELLALLMHFAAGTSVDAGRTIHFHLIDSGELERILPDALHGHPQLTTREFRQIVRRSLWAIRKRGDVSICSFIESVEQEASAELRKPKADFVVWSRLLATQMPFNKGARVTWENTRLELASRLPRYLRLTPYHHGGAGTIDPNEPPFGGFIIGRCKARSAESALDHFSEATELLMALFNLRETRGRYSLSPGDFADGPLRQGPSYFIFKNRNFLPDDYWYNPKYDTRYDSTVQFGSLTY